MAVGLQDFGLQSQPESNRKIAREAAGTSNPNANSNMGLSPREIDRASVDVASVPRHRENGRSGSAYARRNVASGSPGEMERGGERLPSPGFQSSNAHANARAGVSSGEMSSSGRTKALAPQQREGGRVKSSVEQEPVRKELKVAALGMEFGPMNVGQGHGTFSVARAMH
ncbi:MAG: hypothetical protein ABWY64_10535 [Tardiphaga sp.]